MLRKHTNALKRYKKKYYNKEIIIDMGEGWQAKMEVWRVVKRILEVWKIPEAYLWILVEKVYEDEKPTCITYSLASVHMQAMA